MMVSDLLNSAITGIFVGFGSTLGTWLVTRHLIQRLERLEEKISRKEDSQKHAK